MILRRFVPTGVPTLVAAVAAVAAVALTGACSSSRSPSEPSTSADIAGRITAIVPVGNVTGTIRVETDPSSSSGSPKAVASINGQTVIFLRTGEQGELRSLSVGQWVRVWFNGPVAESYPVQGTAATVVVDSVSTPAM